eukprot:7380726-Prymnesium_polylepis.1
MTHCSRRLPLALPLAFAALTTPPTAGGDVMKLRASSPTIPASARRAAQPTLRWAAALVHRRARALCASARAHHVAWRR